MRKTQYKIILKIADKEYIGSGDSAFSALKKIDLNIPKTKGILTVKYKGKEHKRFMFVPQMRRTFHNDLNKEIFGKTLEIAVQ